MLFDRLRHLITAKAVTDRFFKDLFSIIRVHVFQSYHFININTMGTSGRKLEYSLRQIEMIKSQNDKKNEIQLKLESLKIIRFSAYQYLARGIIKKGIST